MREVRQPAKTAAVEQQMQRTVLKAVTGQRILKI
jgi:hypothetical protein